MEGTMSRFLEQAVARCEAFSPTAKARIEEARRCFRGGDTRMSAHFPPHPLFMLESPLRRHL
jgi:hypothetical protein